MTSKGVSQLKFLNRTINSKAYQDNIISDINSNMYAPCPIAYNKITYHAVALQSIGAFLWDQSCDLIGHLTDQI